MGNMRVLILNCDYPGFLTSWYRADRDLSNAPYEDQLTARNRSLFAVADSFSRHLAQLGITAHDVHANNTFLQLAWAREHRNGSRSPIDVQKLRARLLHHVTGSGDRLQRPCPWQIDYSILSRQVDHYRPDVLLIMDMNAVSGEFLERVRPSIRVIAGQHAATPLKSATLRFYDVVLSHYGPLLDRLRRLGVRAEGFDLGFDPRVLERVDVQKRETYSVTFVGSLFPIHRSRLRFLETVAAQLSELRIWTPDKELIPRNSILRGRWAGRAWGAEMFDVLSRSAVTLNHHGDIEPYASNMRLFEATGVGTLLVTDALPNLETLFEVGREVVAYRTPEDCAEQVMHFLANADERRMVASAGQMRTLSQYTYAHRARQLAQRMEQWLAA
jgi:spore maturation protein CgeB